MFTRPSTAALAGAVLIVLAVTGCAGAPPGSLELRQTLAPPSPSDLPSPAPSPAARAGASPTVATSPFPASATTSPSASPAADLAAFWPTWCLVDAELRGALPVDGEDSEAEAIAWFVALDGGDPQAILAASGPIRDHLDALTQVADARIGAAGSVRADASPALTDAVESARLLAQILRNNLDAIVAGARAGRAPDAGVYAYVDDTALVLFQAAMGYRNALPEPPPC